MTDVQDGQVGSQTALLQQVLAEVRATAAHVAELHAEFRRYAPILEAYLRPDATGPGAWAVRRRLAKAGESNGKA